MKEHRKLLVTLSETPKYLTEPLDLIDREYVDTDARRAPPMRHDPFRELAAEMAEEARLLENAVGVSNIEMH